MLTEVETATPSGLKLVSKKFFKIADRLLSVEADAEWAARFAETFISGLHLTPLNGNISTPENLRIVISTEPAPNLPPGLQQFKVPGGICCTEAQRYFLDIRGSRIAVGAKDERRLAIWFGATQEARRTSALITVMAYALPAALRRCGLYDLHAAGMVEPSDGRGFIFPAASESGKTSLAIRLAASGWGYLSDDLLVVSDGDEGVEMRGLRRPFQTSAAALAGCELSRLDEALGVIVPNDPGKRKLDPKIVFPGRFASSAAPRVLCFPMITSAAQSRLEPLGPAEAMTRLIKMCPWSSYDVSSAREHLAVFSRLVKQCRTYALLAGRDIFDNPAGAGALLANCP